MESCVETRVSPRSRNGYLEADEAERAERAERQRVSPSDKLAEAINKVALCSALSICVSIRDTADVINNSRFVRRISGDAYARRYSRTEFNILIVRQDQHDVGLPLARLLVRLIRRLVIVVAVIVIQLVEATALLYASGVRVIRRSVPVGPSGIDTQQQ